MMGFEIGRVFRETCEGTWIMVFSVLNGFVIFLKTKFKLYFAQHQER